MVEIIEVAPQPKKKKRKVHQGGIKYNKLPKGNSASVRRNKLGIPQASPPFTEKLKPNLTVPDTRGEKHLRDEKLLYDVEVMLVKGVTKIDHIAKTLHTSWTLAKKLVERVEYRWALNSNPQQMQQIRGLSKTRLDLITLELWSLHDGTKDDKIKGGALAQLVQVHDRQMLLDGVTEKSIEELRIAGSQGDESIEAKMIEHSNVVNLAAHLHEYLAKKIEGKKDIDDVIEGDFTDA